jgi:hypothetical protein
MRNSLQQRSFCIIRNSGEIRKLIKLRLDNLGVSLYQLCDELSIDYSKFRYYLNTMQPEKASTRMASQGDVIAIAESLGISIGVQVVLRPESKATAKPFDKTKQYINGNNKQKEGTTTQAKESDG